MPGQRRRKKKEEKKRKGKNRERRGEKKTKKKKRRGEEKKKQGSSIDSTRDCILENKRKDEAHRSLPFGKYKSVLRLCPLPSALCVDARLSLNL